MEQCRQKVIVILGATGVGKTKLSVDIASQLGGEIINTDKIQAYKGLPIVTNKVTPEESHGVPHHLIGVLDFDADFTVHDFCCSVLSSICSIIRSRSIPVLVGGSNTYIATLLDDPLYSFRLRYQPCFIWLDIETKLLHWRLSKRVDAMLSSGALAEMRDMFEEGADYTKGVRRAIGMQEMDAYIQAEREEKDEEIRESLLREGVEEMKANTNKLADCQVEKIRRLKEERGWEIHRINTTTVFKGGYGEEEAWEEVVVKPCWDILTTFFMEEEKNGSHMGSSIAITAPTTLTTPVSI